MLQGSFTDAWIMVEWGFKDALRLLRGALRMPLGGFEDDVPNVYCVVSQTDLSVKGGLM
jgi:hypothetical protein